MDQNKTDKPENQTSEKPIMDAQNVTPQDEKPTVGQEIPTAAGETVMKPEETKASFGQEIPESKPTATAPEVTPAIPVGTPPVDTSGPSTSPANAARDSVGYTETKSNKLLYIFVFVLVVVLLSLVGLFFYKQYLNTTTNQNSQSSEPTVAVSPTVAPATEEESELNQIEIPDIDQELSDINKDIEQ